MKLIRKIFYNKRNNQGSITIPRKVLEELQRTNKNKILPEKLSFDILNFKKIKKIKEW